MSHASIDQYHYLITGPSGSGKSYLAAELSKRGYPAFDSDEIPGLASWHRTADCQRAPAPAALTMNFLRQHRVLWDREVLGQWLADHQAGLLFGVSHNSAEQGEQFDRVLLLDVPVDTVLTNLGRQTRANAFGRTREHLEMARTDTAEYYRLAPADWTRLTQRDPIKLVEAIERAVGHRLGDSGKRHA